MLLACHKLHLYIFSIKYVRFGIKHHVDLGSIEITCQNRVPFLILSSQLGFDCITLISSTIKMFCVSLSSFLFPCRTKEKKTNECHSSKKLLQCI